MRAQKRQAVQCFDDAVGCCDENQADFGYGDRRRFPQIFTFWVPSPHLCVYVCVCHSCTNRDRFLKFSNVCEVGFDETAHRCTEIAPDYIPHTVERPPYTVWLGSTEKGGTKIISLVHTLVATLQLRAFGDAPGIRPGERDCVFEQLLHEEAVLPTVPVSNTDHVCVGNAVLRALEKWFCGDILQFIHKLEHVGLLLFVGTADRASSNLKFFKIWRALCGLARCFGCATCARGMRFAPDSESQYLAPRQDEGLQ